MSKLVLIDGHSILNRAFYGVPDLTNSEGLHTNAIYGFLNIMFRILDEEQPEYLAVAFDLKVPTFRHKLFTEYKGTRKPMPGELREQVPVIKDVLAAMNIKILELPGFEADDILGTMAGMGERSDFDVRIISGDRDLLQLATKKVMIRIPKTKKGTTEIENYFDEDVKALYGVTPLEFIDMKALMGDTSDNIPGVKNIGEKTASNIIRDFHSIENAFENAADIKPKRAGELLVADYENAKLSKVLATIDTSAPIECEISDCRISDMFNENAFAVMQKLEFKSILAKFDASVNKKASAIISTTKEITKIIKDKNELKSVINRLKKSEKIAVFGKLEENAPVENQLTFDFINMGTSNTETVYELLVTLTDGAEIFVIKTGDKLSYAFVRDEVSELINTAKKIITPDVKKLLKLFDFSKNYYDKKINVTDIGIGAYLLNPLKDSYNADDVARDYLEEVVSLQNLLKDFYNDKLLINELDEEALLALGTEVYIYYKSEDIILNKLDETGMRKLYDEVETPLAFALNDMENEGVMVDRTALREYGSMLKEKIDKTQEHIYEVIGEEFNINSPKQLGEILFDKLQIPGGKKTKTGYSTSADVLNKLAGEYPVVNEILEYRQLTKLKSTYADGLDNFISEDGRIHGTFNQTITATGRISSTEPNLQNIPIRMEIGKRMRQVFIPKTGCKFIDADYSQIELRILAHMSEDENLIEAYNSAQDIHRITAAKVFKTPFEQVTDQQRSNAKAVNFGIVYGISSFGLSQDLSISRKEADMYIKQYFETYGGIKEFLDDSVAKAKETGYVTTLFGRRRPVPEISSSNFMQRSFGERIAMNSPIQGTAADIMKIAMVNVAKALRDGDFKSKIVLQVHDELLIEAYEDEIDTVKELVAKEMEAAADLKVKLDVGIGVGSDWLEAH